MTELLDRALERARAERAAIDDRREALDEFEERVRGIDPRSPGRLRPDGGTLTASAPTDDRRAEVRRAFAETVAPESADVPEGASPVAGVAAEFDEDLAAALAVDGGAFTPALKRALLGAVDDRRRELAVTARALDAEVDSLAEAADEIEAIAGWIDSADQQPLSECSFGGLRTRHETLERHRERCERLLERRQDHLRETTGTDGAVGVRHRAVVESVYDPFPVDYPVLATGTRLYETCGECQRAIRDHLCRCG